MEKITRRSIISTLAVTPSSRERVESAIEQLIALLDRLDGDCDLEPIMAGFDRNHMDDREGDDERELDLSDDEPYLAGWTATPGCILDAECDAVGVDGASQFAGGARL